MVNPLRRPDAMVSVNPQAGEVWRRRDGGEENTHKHRHIHTFIYLITRNVERERLALIKTQTGACSRFMTLFLII